MKTFSPGRPNGKGFIEWLPTHSDFWYQDVGVVVQKVLKAACPSELERANPWERVYRTYNRDRELGVESVIFAGRVDDFFGRGSEDITLLIRAIRFEVDAFIPELAANG